MSGRLLCPAGGLGHAIKKNVQRPRVGEPWVELSEASCGSVTRVHEGFFAALDRLAIELLEAFLRHEDLAPHVEHVWHGASSQTHGDGANSADVVRDVLAGGAVAARSSRHEEALLI